MLRKLGHGAHGTVYLVKHQKLNTLRAIKFINKSFVDYNYLHEANLMKNLRHSGIPIIYDIEENEQGIFIVEEYVDGQSLSDFMQKNRKMCLEQICDIGLQLCEVLEYLHHKAGKSIVHLDLKPDNILVTQQGQVKVVDFDHAAYAEEKLNRCEGTKGFAAPEQYHRLFPGREADIYGFGMLLLYMLHGGTFETSSAGWSRVQSFQETVYPKQLFLLIKKCTDHNPHLRYTDISRVRRDLMKVQSGVVRKNSLISLTVNIYGMKSGIGTTHIALACTSFLQQHGIKALYVDRTGTDNIYPMTRRARLTKDGTFCMFGIHLLPEYHQFVSVSNEGKYTVRVCDCGNIKQVKACAADSGNNLSEESESLAAEPSERLQSAQIHIMVGSGKDYEMEELVSALAQMKQLVQTQQSAQMKQLVQVKQPAEAATCSLAEPENICILNHMNGQQYYQFKRGICESIRLFRMPCLYEWNHQNETAQSLFCELFGSYYPELVSESSLSIGKIRGYVIEKIHKILGIFREKIQNKTKA